MIAILLALLAVVNVSNNSVSYTCNGVTAAYQVNFPYLTFADLKVTSTTTGGAVTTLVYTTDYTVNFASTSSTATLALNNPAVKCPNTNVLKIARNVTYTQPYSFRAQSVYNQALHEIAYDRLAMQIQQLSFLLNTANTWTALQSFNAGIHVSAPSQSLIMDGFGAASYTGSGGFSFSDGPLRANDGLSADLLTLDPPGAPTVGARLLAIGTGGDVQKTAIPTTLDQAFTAFGPAGMVATQSFARRTYLNASTLTVASNFTTVASGVGGGNYVLKLCSGGGVCTAPNTYLTCTSPCAAGFGQVTACTVNISAIPAGTVLDWVLGTGCAPSPSGNVTAYTTTP